MNRHQRRIGSIEQRRFIREVSKNFDPTRPLVFRGGYTHKGVYCRNPDGGDAERPSNPVGYYCAACDRLVPSTECERAK
jgi:hypothetical protein